MTDADARGSILSAEALLAMRWRDRDDAATIRDRGLYRLSAAEGLHAHQDRAALLVHVEAHQRELREATADAASCRSALITQQRENDILAERLAQADAARLQQLKRNDDLCESYEWEVQQRNQTIAAQAERITHLVKLENERLRVDEDTADALTCFLKWDETPELTLDADTISALHDLKASFKKYRAALVASRSPAQEKACQREVVRQSDDSAAYLSVACTCGKCGAGRSETPRS